MSLRAFALAAAASVVLSVAGGAQAATAYDNGAPDNVTSVLVDGFTVANDFRLDADTRLRGATAYLAFAPDDDTAAAAQVSYGVYADDGGAPGALLTSGAIGAPRFSDTGLRILGAKVWRVDFRFQSDFAAQAGVSYWFALAAPRPFPIVPWSTAAGNGTRGVWLTDFDHPERGFVQQFALENAFALRGASGTPEPAAWALLLAGFGLTGAALRRRRTAAFA